MASQPLQLYQGKQISGGPNNLCITFQGLGYE